MESGLIGAIFGALAVIGAQLITSLLSARRERRQETRVRVASFAAAMGAAQQSMEWITWFGKYYQLTPKAPDPKALRLQLIPPQFDVRRIKFEGEPMIILERLNGNLRIRVFDAGGTMVLDRSEEKLAGRERRVESLKARLEGLWPHDEPKAIEDDTVIDTVASIIGYGRDRVLRAEEYKEDSPCYEQKMRKLVAGYESELKTIWPRILGEIASIASYDSELGKTANELANDLAVYDIRIARANMKKEEYSRPEYTTLYTDVRAFVEDWTKRLANEMRVIDDLSSLEWSDRIPH